VVGLVTMEAVTLLPAFACLVFRISRAERLRGRLVKKESGTGSLRRSALRHEQVLSAREGPIHLHLRECD